MADGETSPVDRLLAGLEERPRPASMRARIWEGLKRSAPFSSLQRRIIFFNLAGLAFLVMGALYLNQFRSGLIEQRVAAMSTLGEVIAVTLAGGVALVPGEADYDPVAAGATLDRLVAPTGLRARLFDRDLRLVGDTGDRAEASAAAAAPAAERGEGGALSTLMDRIGALYRSVERSLGPEQAFPVTRGAEAPESGLAEASRGRIARTVRLNEHDQLIVSVAVPVLRGEAVSGVLLLSTLGDDINHVVRAERAAILQVFVVAAVVSTGLSILLANTIAQPIKRLAAAADSEGTNAARPLNPERVEIPDMTHRTDEIGELSAALIRMTEALYRRIEAIESFASDVAHEVKNPLTSLRSAVDTMAYARTPEQRERLLEVIRNDVGRMDRLVTDISNASRLDADLVRERMETFDLGALIDMLSRIFRDQGSDRGVTIRTEIPAKGLMARGLEGRIAQVVTNFLDNALSFSPDGGTITVSAWRRGDGVRVAVSDEGPGVPPDNMTSVFERFYTERPEAEGFGNHSGLGLAISRQIIEAHGGRIWCENIPDPEGGSDAAPKGARFLFDLPG